MVGTSNQSVPEMAIDLGVCQSEDRQSAVLFKGSSAHVSATVAPENTGLDWQQLNSGSRPFSKDSMQES